VSVQQLSFLDPQEGARLGSRLRDEGIERAQGGAPAVALSEAITAVHHLAARQATLTTDDVWATLTAWGAMTFPEPRAMGAVLKAARRLKYVRPSPRHELSTRPVCHRRPIRMWLSRLHRSDAGGGGG
jgi:hypothetical protein